MEYKQGQNPRFISSIEPANVGDIPPGQKNHNTLINHDRFIYEPISSSYKEFLPIYTNGNSIELVHGAKKTLGHMYIKVNRSCTFNEYNLEQGYYKVLFKRFMRSGKETEIINHKSVYDSKYHKSENFPKEISDELIQELGEFFREN